MDVFVARQPIFDDNQKVVAYELLFRDGFGNAFPGIDGNVATSNVLSNTFFSFEFKEILRNKPGFINFTQELITQKIPLLFPKEDLVIEVLEDVEPAEDVIKALKALKNRGYRLALDDYVHAPKFAPMIDLSDIVKIDFRFNSRAQIASVVQEVRSNRQLTFLAEKIETHQEYELAKKMGFKLFQGYFFSRPEILVSRDISPSQVAKLSLIKELQKSDIDIETVESLVKQDVSLSYKLLKLINSAYFRRPVPVDTIKDAITILGQDELRRFLSIIAVSDLNREKPQELLRRSVIRARMCEKIGTVIPAHFSGDELFTLGLFTLMDAILNSKMEDILSVIGFSDRMNQALLGEVKAFNAVIRMISCFETGQWGAQVFSAISGKGIEKKLPKFYFESVKMANTFFD
jgi:EAL and modified HD-GYP domain-containing signal transduction protein